MTEVGGNTTAQLQVCRTAKNSIGEQIPSWETEYMLTGWLDLSSGSASYNTFNAKVQESSHVFLCDYVPISVKAESCRVVIDHEVYDVLLIDDPMGMHFQLELYLKYTGG